jgi:hypothetical protein
MATPIIIAVITTTAATAGVTVTGDIGIGVVTVVGVTVIGAATVTGAGTVATIAATKRN